MTGYQITPGEGKAVRIWHVRPFSAYLNRPISPGKGKAWNALKGPPGPDCFHQFGHNRCPIPSHNGINGPIGEILRHTGGMNSTYKRETAWIPPFDLATEFLHLIHSGNVGTGPDNLGPELLEAAFEAPLDDHVEDLNLMTFKACGDILEFEGFTDHDVLQTNGMTRNGWTNEKNPHRHFLKDARRYPAMDVVSVLHIYNPYDRTHVWPERCRLGKTLRRIARQVNNLSYSFQ